MQSTCWHLRTTDFSLREPLVERVGPHRRFGIGYAQPRRPDQGSVPYLNKLVGDYGQGLNAAETSLSLGYRF